MTTEDHSVLLGKKETKDNSVIMSVVFYKLRAIQCLSLSHI